MSGSKERSKSNVLYVHPDDAMYFLYSWAEAGLDAWFGMLNPWFSAKDVFGETEARKRGLLEEWED
jgi:hypothetical protein